MKNIKIKMFLILCIVILLSSCKRSNGILTPISPYKYQVEYCGNKIIISKITNTGDTTSRIWKKRNGEYFDENNHLKMSLKNSNYSYQQKINNKNAELLTTILKENDSLYSSTTICLRKSYVEDMGVAVYYDKSYRIKKIQAGVLYEFSNK